MTKIRQLTLYFLIFAVTCTFITPVGAQQLPKKNSNVRVLIEVDDYKLSKYEPKKGAYLGAYVYQDTLINGDMKKFNELTGKKHASFFIYVGYGSPFPQKWIDQLKEVGAAAHIAFEPNNGLDQVKDDQYLRNFARKLKESGIPVFLRFASEMNGDWTAYSGDPKKYIEKWRLVHDVMEEEAPNVMMVWTVFTFPQSNILAYYPGDEYVDWVGVNIYNVVYHNNNIKLKADHEDPLELLNYVYDTFSERKPIQISEFGATHYTITDGKYYVDFAIEKITRMYNGLKTKYPRVKSIFYFDVNNLVNAPSGRRINNYAITDDERILKTYSNLISDPYFLSDVGPNLEGTVNNEFMVVKDGILVLNGKTFVSSSVLKKYMKAKVFWDSQNNKLTLLKGGNTITFDIKSYEDIANGKKGAFILNGNSYFPLTEVAPQIGYEVKWDGKEKLIKVSLSS
ncbi:copper amine oxidase domain protein [Thermoanaerobacter italicus Ab9]|uniref:Copper amine oxidase domain protein n=1 Tax=Thermoanaerobacter italicus (strain DSM 9252 / Ab9) TaxID=580331 RepID=D3T674_THEIA|nr:stalk domain-containing protein [Thermoanaerobacter italicus]ADD03468.1 copper amine oxidase domain protein [Thermoanaerobacter italicus Ab9]